MVGTSSHPVVTVCVCARAEGRTKPDAGAAVVAAVAASDSSDMQRGPYDIVLKPVWPCDIVLKHVSKPLWPYDIGFDPLKQHMCYINNNIICGF